MSFTPTKETELPGLATAVAEASPEPDEVEYPERGWIAQSISHGDAVAQAKLALRSHFRDRPDVLVAMELAVYYQRGDDKVWLQPDVQVVFGVSPEDRPSYRIWEEGKAPDFVLEVASPSTTDRDAEYKAEEYASIGVREYWRLDPQGTLMGMPLEGYEAGGGRNEPMQPVASTDGGRWLQSRVLGLELRSRRQDRATVLVFRDPRTGEEFDGALEEAERLRRIAERGSRAAKQEASTAKQEASAARQEANAAKQEASTAKQEASTAKQEASAATKRVRKLEERLRALTAHSAPPERGR